jgi:hypothetical protein
MRQPKTTTGHKRPTDALTIGRDGVVRDAELDRLGVNLLVVRFGENSHGRRCIHSLEVTHPEGVTINLLRQLPLERIEQHERARKKSVGWYGDSADVIAQLPSSPRGSQRFYHDVAAAYLSQVKDGVRTPALAIANAKGVPLSTARGWIHRARVLGYLPAARRGAAG